MRNVGFVVSSVSLLMACGSGTSSPEATPSPTKPGAADGGPSPSGEVVGHAALPACDAGSARDVSGIVRDECGLFVAPGGTGTGARAAPLGAIGDAVAAARVQKKSAVFVCAGTYNESLTLAGSEPIRIFGGLACDTWTHGPQHAVTIKAKTSQGVRVDGLTIALEDLTLDSPDATQPGSFSAALFARNAQVKAQRVTFRAGRGAAGAIGVTGNNHFPALDGEYQGKVCACPLFGKSVGGAPGTSGQSPQVGGRGGAEPLQTTPPETSVSSKGGGVDCYPGYAGLPGRPAPGGAAGLAPVLVKEGWASAVGATGAHGFPGSGGGGAGGSTQTEPIGNPPIGFRFLSGGGGACGGCGGAGGGGGSGGGASLGIVSIDSTLTLGNSTIMASEGGAGGAGAVGQPGQGGGTGATSVCSYIEGRSKGGDGGNGGAGGGGGGGAGGPSIGIAYIGTAPSLDNASVTDEVATHPAIQIGRAGAGGAGGVNGAGIPSGAAGLAGTAFAVKRF